MSFPSLRDELVAMTCDLVAIPSVADRPDQLVAAIEYAERFARAIPGIFVSRFDEAGVPSVVATLRETRTPALMLNAHLDVVPAQPEQFTPVVRDGRIYGRGSQDMKGSGAVLLRLLRDLAALPEPPDVGFQFVGDEEIGGHHSSGMLSRQGWLCDFFLVGEPTDLQICYAHKGAMWVDVELDGRPAHGSRPWEGDNPFVALREGLAAMELAFPTPDEAAWLTTVVPTKISGGDAGNRVPKQLVLTLDVRTIPTDSPHEVLATLQSCFAGTVTARTIAPPLNTDPQHPIVRKLDQDIAAITGAPVGYYREHFSTDARYYSALGIPAVCLGPIGAGLHSDEEWVDIASLETLYHILYRFATER